MVWNDEFDGPALDLTKWSMLGNQKRRDGHWDNADVLIGDGLLRLRVRREGNRVTSGAISSAGKFERAFGYFVARCRMPRQPGHWPGFWLMCPGATAPHTDGRGGAEIDIVEMPWRQGHVCLLVHWGGYQPYPKTVDTLVALPGGIEGFHTYGLLWTPVEYVFFVDGAEAWRTTGGGVSQVPEYINLTEEAGVWAGDIGRASLPDTFEVDYVRVYEAVAVDSLAPPGGRAPRL